MENLYSWLIIFSGATITLLGSFLFSSERELRSKRREFDEFKRKQTAKPIALSTETEHPETHLSMELITKSEELAKEVAALSNKLEAGHKTLEESFRSRDPRWMCSSVKAICRRFTRRCRLPAKASTFPRLSA